MTYLSDKKQVAISGGWYWMSRNTRRSKRGLPDQRLS